MVWRVGDGRSVAIWGDRWLPTKITHKIQSPPHILGATAKVCELIDSATNWWNIPPVETVFNPEEARIICGMTICPRTQKDQLIWGANKQGPFTVRSAYHLAKEVRRRTEGSTSTSTNMHQIWKRIWRIKGPRMVKMFMWQACSNILPTRENLFKRKVMIDSLCPICQIEVESVGHALWSCPDATDVWLACLKRIQKTTSDEDVFFTYF